MSAYIRASLRRTSAWSAFPDELHHRRQSCQRGRTAAGSGIASSAAAQQLFSLEPMAIFVDDEKLSSRAGDVKCFDAYLRLARASFYEIQTEGDVPPRIRASVVETYVCYDTLHLHEVSLMFQLWALGLQAGPGHRDTGALQAKSQPNVSKLRLVRENLPVTCAHILYCKLTMTRLFMGQSHFSIDG